MFIYLQDDERKNIKTTLVQLLLYFIYSHAISTTLLGMPMEVI